LEIQKDRKDTETEIVFEEIMAENILEQMKVTNPD
jgi:hypothetical protein